jgi:hypothetical protein
MSTRVRRILVVAVTVSIAAAAQTIRLEAARAADFPAIVDSNSPAYWSGSQQYIFNSLDLPIRSEAASATRFSRARAVSIAGDNHWRWIESVWADADGTVYAWYHAEPLNVCPGTRLTAPQIGALVSTDGVFFDDLGIVISAGDPPDCNSHNLYFAGGHGDFTVIPDRDNGYFYFLFTNYGGPAESQGIGIARMAFADRAHPVGRVFKWFNGAWNQPGLRGALTPVFPARASWNLDNPDSFWGAAVHWNQALRQYVVLLNHAVAADWSQEGVYISFNPNIADPSGWMEPAKLLDGGAGWYPQVLAAGAGESDTLVGATARLYTMGHSEWAIHFARGPFDIQIGPANPPAEPSQPVTAAARHGKRQPAASR